MKLHNYTTPSGKDVIQSYIKSLEHAEKVDAEEVLDRMIVNKFDEIRTKIWQGKVWEVYFYKHNRIFYVIVENENCYLLHACRKQKNKTEKRDKDIVTKRAKEIGQLLGKKFI